MKDESSTFPAKPEILDICSTLINMAKIIQFNTIKATKVKAEKTKIEHRDDQIMRVLQKIQEAGKKSPDLLNEKYQDSDRSRFILNGLCYVMSECMYHLFPNKLTPYRILWDNGGTHWFLKSQDGTIIDTIAPDGREACSHSDYARAERKNFYSKYPSKRAKILLDRAGLSLP
jgi:hypothetical protein